MITRRELSGYIVDTLKTTEHIDDVGLAQAPHSAGWSDQPNKDLSSFRPYAVVNPGASGGHTGPIGGNLQDWQLPYMVSAFGVAPEQTEFIADAIRYKFVSMRNSVITLGEYDYKIQQVKIESIGSIQRADTTEPPFFGQTDSYSVWLSKEPM